MYLEDVVRSREEKVEKKVCVCVSESEREREKLNVNYGSGKENNLRTTSELK